MSGPLPFFSIPGPNDRKGWGRRIRGKGAQIEGAQKEGAQKRERREDEAQISGALRNYSKSKKLAGAQNSRSAK